MTEVNMEQNRKIEDVTFILRDFLKVIKVVYMYPEDNPLPQSLKRSFAEKLVTLVEAYGDLVIGVDKSRLTCDGETVFKDKSKEESLAAIFFETGITEFTFSVGLEVEDMYKILDVFKNYLNSHGRSYDIVSGLWESHVKGFRFQTVEDVALTEYDSNFDFQAYMSYGERNPEDHDGTRTFNDSDYKGIFVGHVDLGDSGDSGGVPAESRDSQSMSPVTREEALFYARSFGTDDSEDADDGGDEIAMNVAAAAGIFGFNEDAPVRRGLPSTTIILNDELKLSEAEEEHISDLVETDAEFEPYESTVELLKEMLLQEGELQQFSETVTICEKVMAEFMEQGHLLEATQILSHLKQLQGEIGKEHPVWVERLKEALIAAGSREKLRQLRESLNNYPETGSAILRKYLTNFGWEALSGITEILASIHEQRHRDTICDYLAEYGRGNLNILSRGITERNIDVVMTSISILARIPDDKVFNYLEKALTHESPQVRAKLIESLKNDLSERAVDFLGRLARDRDREVRRAAIRALGDASGEHGFNAIAEIINDEQFVRIEEDEQRLLLVTLSRLGGDDAVAYLRGLILKYNPARRRYLKFLREAAFEALAMNPGDKAERTLVRLSGNWRPHVRRLARSAMHHRRVLIYGGKNDGE